ncbi:MAG TPA: hypothetical protein VLD16_01265 [Gaiellaceae bacterium]|nr:hypothetical protein [Gaiellaceae bacterium]
MSERARLNRVLAALLVVWSSAVIVFGVAKGLPSPDTPYHAGQLFGFVFAFVILGIGVRGLTGVPGSSSAYDEFDGGGAGRRWGRRAATVVLVPVLLLAVGGGAVGLWHHLRERRADALAVRYGAASSSSEVTLADRCTGVLRDSYDRYDKPVKVAFPPHTFAVIAPRVCTLGVQRGLVAKDGTMSEQSGYELMVAAVRNLGVARFQTIAFTELAVTRYHLARPGKVTPWDRCVAMGYSGWEARRSQEKLPSRERFFPAVRETCRLGIERGIIPASGAPLPGSRASSALQLLLASQLAKQSR